MTALNWLSTSEGIYLAMDTLVVDPSNFDPSFFTTKMYFLPHLHGVMACTGIGQFGVSWFAQLQHGLLVRDLAHVNEFAPAMLRETWRRMSEDVARSLPSREALTSTIYHFGYLRGEDRFITYAFRSTNDFVVEELNHGFSTKPPTRVDKQILELPKDFIDAMEQQRSEQDQLPLSERVFIGGDIIVASITRDGIGTWCAHRFADYEETYQRMCDRLPANQQFRDLWRLLGFET